MVSGVGATLWTGDPPLQATLKVLRVQGQSLTALQRMIVLKGLSDVTAKRAGEG